jgi:cysteine desulfurase
MTIREFRIYLDHNSTAPLMPEAGEALLAALSLTGNPSSVHAEGRRVRSLVEDARRKVASLLHAEPENIVFTSGATEAANTCLTPRWMQDGEELVLSGLAVSDADHPATREGGRFEFSKVRRLPVDAAGVLRLDALDVWIAESHAPRMLSLTLANSETGVIQPLKPIVERLKGTGILLILDIVQAAGRIDLAEAAEHADALLVSGHKIGAAKGIGAYALRRAGLRPFPLLVGGGQERRHRAGTEAVPLIAGFGAAAEVAQRRLATEAETTLKLRERLLKAIEASGASHLLFGAAAERLPNTVTIAAPGLRAETAQIALDLAGFAVSSGSACSSGKVGPSHVLEAMQTGGLAIDAAAGAIRVSFGYETTESEIDQFSEAFIRLLRRAEASEAGRVAA